jgi:hypothetical protein
MVKLKQLLLVLLIIVAAGFYGYSDDASNMNIKLMPLSNSGFETADANALPAGWQVRGHGKTDTAVFHSGAKSLKFSHGDWGQSAVLSGPLRLKVGHLYRLSGWLKTEAAETRPLDRYPTSVAACLTMESLPFTNHSPSMGGASDWTKIETLFIATRSSDRVRLHLGYNGDARGNAWFDDIRVEKVEDITAFIPMETVQWFGPAFRYDDKGWIFVHIEGKPYQRGYQYGYLTANEIVSYMKKLGYQYNNDKPENGWRQLRRITHAFMLDKYEEEYLTEMKGIADGAAKAGAKYDGGKIDLVDIVTLNSSIDIGQIWSALRRQPNALSGKSFLAAEDELNIPIREHKCSGFLANGPATPNGDIVFGQIFMWGGYTGVHWNVICDVVPDKGHRLVYETFPGGIHSGADFYINSAGLMMGETTTSQTPYDRTGTPQSNRIRKAAQYASGIDEAAKILFHKNNGQYTNDWLMGDTKTNEIAIFLLGTKKTKLWRSGSGEFPGGTKGFFWSNNNNKDNEVRKEYIANKDNAPYDLVFSPWNRDIAFNRFFKKYNGKIDSIAGVNLWASSPINRPHACDGKITTTEMAKELVFLAHFGKVTLRGKYPALNRRIMRPSPGATPHLSLGYSIISPKFVTDKLKALKKKMDAEKKEKTAKKSAGKDFSKVEEIYTFNSRDLWFNTVYPATDKENWFVSGTSAYWNMLKWMPESTAKAADNLKDGLSRIHAQLVDVTAAEGAIAPLEAKRMYDRYNHYRIPRIKGTFLLHQLRLYLGNKKFSKLMNAVHNRFKDKSMSNKQFLAEAKKAAGKSLKPFVMQWLERKSLPHLAVEVKREKAGEKWKLSLTVTQKGEPYHFITTVAIKTGKEMRYEKVEVSKASQAFTFTLPEEPRCVKFNAGNDIPVSAENFKHFYTFSNYFENFHEAMFVYGTSRQIEVNHELALRFRLKLANRFTEILPPLRKDSEITDDELKNNDLLVLGGPADNGLARKLIAKLGLEVGKNWFKWQGKTYGKEDEGLFVALPNPYNKKRVVYLFIANSALELFHITDSYRRLPSWTLFKGAKEVEKGYHEVKEFHQCLK